MKILLVCICSFSLLFGCATKEVDSVAKPQSEKPARIRVGMSESEILSILGTPKRKSYIEENNGEVIEFWFYRHLVREWQAIQDTDFESVQKVNLITGEMEETVVPIESTVTRSLFQEITLKINNGKVIEITSEMDEDLNEVLD